MQKSSIVFSATAETETSRARGIVVKNHAILDNRDLPKMQLISQRCVKDFRLADYAESCSAKKQRTDDVISPSDLDDILRKLSSEATSSEVDTAADIRNNDDVAVKRTVDLKRKLPSRDDDEVCQILFDLRTKIDEWCSGTN